VFGDDDGGSFYLFFHRSIILKVNVIRIKSGVVLYNDMSFFIPYVDVEKMLQGIFIWELLIFTAF
jgi:hypothetical protein